MKKLLLFSIFYCIFNSFFCAEGSQTSGKLSSDDSKNNDMLEPLEVQNIKNIVCQYIDNWDLQQVNEHSTLIKQIAKSADGKLLASLSDGCIKLWNINNISNINCVNTLKFDDETPICLDISHNSKYLVLGFFNNKKFEIYDIQNAEKINKVGQLSTNPGNITKLKFSSNDNFMLIGIGEDDSKFGNFSEEEPNSKIAIFDLADINNIKLTEVKNQFDGSHYWSVNIIVCSTNGKLIATADTYRNIIIWDASDLPRLSKICNLETDSVNLKNWNDFTDAPNLTSTQSLVFSPDDKYLASTNRSMLQLWNLKDINNIKCMIKIENPDYTSFNQSIDYSPEGNYLVCGLSNSTLRIFNLSGFLKQKINWNDFGTSVKQVNKNGEGIILFANNGNSIFSCGNNNKINIWINQAKFLSLNYDSISNINNNKYILKYACSFCNKEASNLLRCSRCRNARYCNIECQRNDWINHKKNCKQA